MVTIYDITGRQVQTLINEQQTAGLYLVEWTGRGVGSGLYFYRVGSEKELTVKKLVLLE